MTPTTLPLLPHYPKSLTTGQAHAVLPQVIFATCSGCKRLLDPYEIAAIHRKCGMTACYPCTTKFIDEINKQNVAPICGGCNHRLDEVCQAPIAGAKISETTLDVDGQPVPHVIQGALELNVEGIPCLYLRATNVAIALPETCASTSAVHKAETEHAKVTKERNDLQVEGTALFAHFNVVQGNLNTLIDDFDRVWRDLQPWQKNKFLGDDSSSNNYNYNYNNQGGNNQTGNNQGGNQQGNQQQGGQNGGNGGRNNNNWNRNRNRNRSGGRSPSLPPYTRQQQQQQQPR